MLEATHHGQLVKEYRESKAGITQVERAACRREQSSNHGSREANTYVVQITGKSARMDHVRQQKRVRDGDRMIWKGTSVPPLRPR